MSIKFLVDAHLSPDIAIQGRNKGLDIVHVNEVELKDADDAEIWEYALNEWYCMVSVDVGFRVQAEDTIATGTDIPGFFAIHEQIKSKKSIGRILDMLILHHEAIEAGAADYDTDIKNQIIWIS